MYESPRAERLYPETEEIMDLDFLLASPETEENDNEAAIDDLLSGLL